MCVRECVCDRERVGRGEKRERKGQRAGKKKLRKKIKERKESQKETEEQEERPSLLARKKKMESKKNREIW